MSAKPLKGVYADAIPSYSTTYLADYIRICYINFTVIISYNNAYFGSYSWVIKLCDRALQFHIERYSCIY